MAAVANCMIMAMAKPMNNWLKISLMPSAVTGSMRGTSSCMDKKMVNTKPMDMRMRKLTARIEKMEEKAKNAEMRSMGHNRA